MTTVLTESGYFQTKEKLARLEKRLAELDRGHQLSPQHRSEAERSYEQMISQYRREIKLYEASRSESSAP
jgi:hypothetical protein